VDPTLFDELALYVYSWLHTYPYPVWAQEYLISQQKIRSDAKRSTLSLIQIETQSQSQSNTNSHSNMKLNQSPDPAAAHIVIPDHSPSTLSPSFSLSSSAPSATLSPSASISPSTTVYPSSTPTLLLSVPSSSSSAINPETSSTISLSTISPSTDSSSSLPIVIPTDTTFSGNLTSSDQLP
jgi:hypothetical protein